MVDVPEMDGEHEVLFHQLASLQHALAEDRLQAATPLLKKLKAHAAEHFSHEERNMRASRYGHYGWHRRQHQAAQTKVALLERSLRLGDTRAARETADSFGRWLRDHIAIADRMLGAHLRNHAREHAARAS